MVMKVSTRRGARQKVFDDGGRCSQWWPVVEWRPEERIRVITGEGEG